MASNSRVEQGDTPRREWWRIGTLLALCALFVSVVDVGSSQALVHPPKEVFGSAAQPSFVRADKVAVDPATGDILVLDIVEFSSGSSFPLRGTISKFGPNGEAVPFVALGTNVIDGSGSGSGMGMACTPPSSECDETPQNALNGRFQIAIAPPGSAAGTAGNIYVSQEGNNVVSVFSSAGRYLGELTESSEGPFGDGVSRAGSCGVAVDGAGSVYVADRVAVHKFVPSANPPVNADNTVTFDGSDRCDLAAGAAGSDGHVFAAEGGQGGVVALDSTTGEAEFDLAPTGNSGIAIVAVDSATGRLFVASDTEVREFDVSGGEPSEPASTISTEEPGSPLAGWPSIKGVAVSPVGPASGDVYLSAGPLPQEPLRSPHLGVWGPAEKLAPGIRELVAWNVGPRQATVGAEVRAEESPTDFHIEYGTVGPCSSNPCSSTAPASAGSANTFAPVTAELEGLEPGTRYFWQLVATNEIGTTTSEDMSFRTFAEHPFLLPDRRLWEMVSPADKRNGEVAVPGNPGGQAQFTVEPQQSSPDGEAVTYASFTAFGDAEGGPLAGQYLSRRGPAGWSTQNLNPLFEEGFARDPLVGFSSDLSHGAVVNFNPPLPPGESQAAPDNWNLYVRDNGTGGLRLLTENLEVAPGAQYCVGFAGFSAGADRAIFAVKNARLRPEDPLPAGSAVNLYEWSSTNGVRLASVLPDGSAATPSGLTSFGASTALAGCNMEDANLRHAFSTDGSRAFWTYRNPSELPGGFFEIAPGRFAKFPLLARIGDSGETVQLDAVQGGTSFFGGEGVYQDASLDGSKVFFTDGLRLTPDSTRASGSRPDLYRYDFDRPPGSRLENLTPPPASEAAGVVGVLGASARGDHVYFAALGVLSDSSNSRGEEAVAGQRNLYAWHEGDSEPRYIATLSNAESTNWRLKPSQQTARVSPNGSYLAFVSKRSLTGFDNRLPPGQTTALGCPAAVCDQVFRYDFHSDELSCVSCNPSGGRPLGSSRVPTWPVPYEQPRYLLDDGRVFFESDDSLDLNDTNLKRDVYQFESTGTGSCSSSAPTFSVDAQGCIDLISSGTSADRSYFVDASSSGQDIFISTRQRLVPQLDKDTVHDVYDARVDGERPVIVHPPCPEGKCPGPGSTPGLFPRAGSRTHSGPPDPKPTRPRCPKGKRRVLRKGGYRCVPRRCRKGTRGIVRQGKRRCVRKKAVRRRCHGKARRVVRRGKRRCVRKAVPRRCRRKATRQGKRRCVRRQAKRRRASRKSRSEHATVHQNGNRRGGR